MRLSTLLATLTLVATPATAAHAQTFFVPGAEVDGQISVQVNATLNDGIGDYHPIANLALVLYRGATDSLPLRTDEAGVLKLAIAPGTYRLSTPEPVRWHGRSYRWNVPLEVKRGMGIVNLTVANATVSGGAAGAQGDLAAAPSASRAGEGSVVRYAQKDGAVGVLFGFLLTGGGSSTRATTPRAPSCSG